MDALALAREYGLRANKGCYSAEHGLRVAVRWYRLLFS